MFGRYINGPPTVTLGQTYGEYIPGASQGLTGEILAVAINYINNSVSNYRAYVGNYRTLSGGPGVGFQIIGNLSSGSSGSFEISLAVGSGLNINPNEYIGIYIEDGGGGGNAPPQVIIEGTVYYSLK